MLSVSDISSAFILIGVLFEIDLSTLFSFFIDFRGSRYLPDINSFSRAGGRGGGGGGGESLKTVFGGGGGGVVSIGGGGFFT